MSIINNENFISLKRAVLNKYFGRMNDMQRKAVFCVNGPVLILAGAGSGKTTVLVNRIANMVKFGNAYENSSVPNHIDEKDIGLLEAYLKGDTDDINAVAEIIATDVVKPWSILAITFTNKAAGELKARLKALLGDDAEDIQASTFHSACVRILRREIDALGYKSGFTIYDTDDSIRVIKEIMKSNSIDEKVFTPRSMLSAMGRAKDTLITPQELLNTSGEYREQVVAKIYEEYQKQLKIANALDFDDIITLTVRLFTECPDILAKYQNRYKYVMVDEYQDTNNAQYRLVSLLSQKHDNLCVVGDDDQSIYKFRGATIENILSFENQFKAPLVIRLEQNYRCSQVILDAANAVIDNNIQRKGKTLWTENQKGELVNVFRGNDEGEEAEKISEVITNNMNKGIKFAEHAILYRMNAQSNSIERALVRHGIPYKIIGGVKFYERKEIKDVLAYLSLVNNSLDNLRLKRIVNEPKRGIGAATLDTCQEIAENLGISMFEAMKNADNYAPLSKKSKPLMEFAEIISDIMAKADIAPLTEIFDDVLDRTGYMKSLIAQGFEGVGRIENVEELKSNIIKYMEANEEPTLSGFLEEIALYTDLDTLNTDDDKVVMMTIHSAKGLEFGTVFIIGMEEGIFPGVQSMYIPAEVEEERRLAYVGITRAKSELYITNAAQRLIFGQTARNKPSRFVSEIPTELCNIEDKTLTTKRIEFSGNRVGEKRPLISSNDIGIGGSRPKIGLGIGVGHTPQPKAPQRSNIKAGDTVTHKIFGAGMVISVKPMGGDNLAEVAFEKVGTKKVMSTMLK